MDMSILPQRNRSWWKAAGTGVLVLCLVITGKAAALPAASASAQAGSRFAIADFDGDSQPDLATVQVGQVTASHARYWIHFQLSKGPRQFIGVTAPVGGLEIALRDVNGDRSLDLIVTTAWLNQLVAVLLNDGHGNFTLHDPASFPESVLGYETSCSPASVQVKDAAAVFTRASGDCELNHAVSCVPRLSGRLRFEPPQDPVFSLGFPVLGRAPPVFVYHA